MRAEEWCLDSGATYEVDGLPLVANWSKGEFTARAVARMVGCPKNQIQVAIDGCGAPVFYVPLKNIALGYARLAAAQPDSPAGLLMAAIQRYGRYDG